MASRRLAVMAHYDPRGEVAPHARRQIEALAQATSQTVVVSTAPLTDASRRWVGQRCELVERANYGYDFFSYREGLLSRRLTDFDEVVVCNDSYVGPLRSYERIFEEMAEVPHDFWGFAASERIVRHLQSYFVVFRPWVVDSRAFTRFWSDMVPVSHRRQVIRRYEVGLTRTLADAGFGFGSYFRATPAETALARRRVVWWAAHMQPVAGGTRWDRWWELARQECNPAVAHADSALDDARLPYVKLDTLRYDPYHLDAASLLGLCERRFPAEFDGVRAFLADTARFYPFRSGERPLPTARALRPLRPLVEYRDAA